MDRDGSSVVGIDASDFDDDADSSVAGVGGRASTGGAGDAFLGGGEGAGVDMWALRGDRVARDRAHRRARAEMKRFTVSKKFPLDVGVIHVHSLGKVLFFFFWS